MLVTAFAAFLSGCAFTLGLLVRNGNPRADQIQGELDELRKLSDSAEATHADECRRFRIRSEEFCAEREAWNKERQSLVASVEYWKNGASTESADRAVSCSSPAFWQIPLTTTENAAK